MKRNAFFVISLVLCILLFGYARADALILVMSPNTTLPGGSPGFDLVGTQPGPIGSPTEFLVGFNSPASDNSPVLDLTKPPNPIINNSSTGLDWSIFWGMRPPNPNTPFTFTFCGPGPTTIPGTDISTYCFGASDGTNSFDIFFDITGPAPIDPASWVTCGPGPASCGPGPQSFNAVQFNFSFMATGDPSLAFSVNENGQPLNFSPVPEPSTLLLLGSGLTGLVAVGRLRIKK